MAQKIIFFDGVCNLCNSAVQFVIRHDRQKKFMFSSLQSDYAQEVFPHLSQNNPNKSVIFKDGDKIYLQSAAALHIARQLNWPFPLLFAFIIIPPVIRDWIYQIIAKNRYRWFGKMNDCMLPSPELKDRFLN